MTTIYKYFNSEFMFKPITNPTWRFTEAFLNNFSEKNVQITSVNLIVSNAKLSRQYNALLKLQFLNKNQI